MLHHSMRNDISKEYIVCDKMLISRIDNPCNEVAFVPRRGTWLSREMGINSLRLALETQPRNTLSRVHQQEHWMAL